MNEAEREAIAKRAHELFVQRGGHHGQHEDDWLEAEKEVKKGVSKVDSHYKDNNRMFQSHGKRGHRHGGSG